jgi:hypothetical protein
MALTGGQRAWKNRQKVKTTDPEKHEALKEASRRRAHKSRVKCVTSIEKFYVSLSDIYLGLVF